jgi:hypothetical protein
MSSLTPGEQDILQHPNVLLAVDLLDLVPVPSKTYKTNIAIAARVDTWLSDFITAPPRPASPPRTMVDIWLTPIVDPSSLKIGFCPF